jgi:hypothetical protein
MTVLLGSAALSALRSAVLFLEELYSLLKNSLSALVLKDFRTCLSALALKELKTLFQHWF